MVNNAATAMAQAPERAGIFARFNDVFMRINRAGKTAMNALSVGQASAALAAGDLQGALSSLPGALGAVAGGAFQLGGTLHELFTGAKAEAAALAKEMEDLGRRSGFKSETRDVERQVAIEKEMDPLRKIELQRQHELAQVRQEIHKMQTDGATQEAVALVAARERLVNAKADNAIRDHNTKLAEQQRKDEEDALKLVQQQADARAKAFAAAEKEYDTARSELAIFNEQDAVKKIEMQRDHDLNMLYRDRATLVEQIGETAADQLLDAKAALITSKAAKDLDEERGRLAKERAQDELKAAEEQLRGIKMPTAFTSSIQASVGGAFTFANTAVQDKLRDAMLKQADLTAKIKDLVARIEANVRGGQPAIT